MNQILDTVRDLQLQHSSKSCVSSRLHEREIDPSHDGQAFAQRAHN
jgi:hypothetical protein